MLCFFDVIYLPLNLNISIQLLPADQSVCRPGLLMSESGCMASGILCSRRYPKMETKVSQRLLIFSLRPQLHPAIPHILEVHLPGTLNASTPNSPCMHDQGARTFPLRMFSSYLAARTPYFIPKFHLLNKEWLHTFLQRDIMHNTTIRRRARMCLNMCVCALSA